MDKCPYSGPSFHSEGGLRPSSFKKHHKVYNSAFVLYDWITEAVELENHMNLWKNYLDQCCEPDQAVSLKRRNSKESFIHELYLHDYFYAKEVDFKHFRERWQLKINSEFYNKYTIIYY